MSDLSPPSELARAIRDTTGAHEFNIQKESKRFVTLIKALEQMGFPTKAKYYVLWAIDQRALNLAAVRLAANMLDKWSLDDCKARLLLIAETYLKE